MSDGAHYRVATRHDLTARQREVLELIARGHTNPEIAERLGISLEGAKHHVSEILSKLDVPSREAAAAWWRETRPSPIARLARALWGWPAAGAGVAAGVVAVVAAVVLTIGIEPSQGNSAQPTPQVVRPCRSGQIRYSLIQNTPDGAVYFGVTATSPDAPCRARGTVNLVPVRARPDEPANVGFPISANFSPQVDARIEPAGTELLVLRWSNWCQGSGVIVWRPMSTLPFAGTEPFLDDAAPVCTARSQSSVLARVDGPAPVTHSIQIVSGACRADDLTFGLYEESGWRPAGPALLEVQPSASSCSVYQGKLSASLFIEGVFVGSAEIEIDAPLGSAGYRMPFLWNGPCAPAEVRLEVALQGTGTDISATLYPTARPHCEGAPATHSIRAGW